MNLLQPPFVGKTDKSTKENNKLFCKGEFEIPYDDTMDEDSKNFIQICMEKNPKKRAKFKDLENHPFLKDFNMKG